jgi:hypothetical protein
MIAVRRRSPLGWLRPLVLCHSPSKIQPATRCLQFLQLLQNNHRTSRHSYDFCSTVARPPPARRSRSKPSPSSRDGSLLRDWCPPLPQTPPMHRQQLQRDPRRGPCTDGQPLRHASSFRRYGFFHPESSHIPSYARGTNRLDYALVSTEFLPQVTAAGLNHYHEYYPSDHRPIFVQIDPAFFGTIPTLAPVHYATIRP